METNNHDNPDLQRLNEMVGNPYMYRRRNLTIRGYEFIADGAKIKIDTHGGRPVVCFTGALGDKLDEFLPVEDQLSTGEKSAAMTVFEQEKSQMATLEKKLMNQIEKVDKNPEYVEQAKEINNTAKNLIKLNGQKVEMLKEIRKTKKS